MKSALSAGLVAALLFPRSALTGHTEDSCPRLAYGSDRVTCHVEIADTQTLVLPGKEHHHHHDNDKHKDHDHKDKDHKKNDHKDKHHKDKDHDHHKKEQIEIIRTVKGYTWSFFWNYVITDECPTLTARLAAIIPVLAPLPHAVNCRVEVRWSHEKANPGNMSLAYAGYHQFNPRDLPAAMHWPLPASFDPPARHITASKEWGVVYESAHIGALNTLGIHGVPGHDFSQSWGKPVVAYDGHDFHQQNNDHHHHHGHHHKQQTNVTTQTIKGYTRNGGHYNTKNLFSCWVYEGRLRKTTTEITPPREKHHHHHNDKHGHHDQHGHDNQHGHQGDSHQGRTQFGGTSWQGAKLPAFPVFEPLTWASCEPHIPPPPPKCEDNCDGQACGWGHEGGDHHEGGHHDEDEDHEDHGEDDDHHGEDHDHEDHDGEDHDHDDHGHGDHGDEDHDDKDHDHEGHGHGDHGDEDHGNEDHGHEDHENEDHGHEDHDNENHGHENNGHEDHHDEDHHERQIKHDVGSGCGGGPSCRGKQEVTETCPSTSCGWTNKKDGGCVFESCDDDDDDDDGSDDDCEDDCEEDDDEDDGENDDCEDDCEEDDEDDGCDEDGCEELCGGSC